MPRKEKFFAQPPLELVRQVLDYGFLYNRKTQQPNMIMNLEVIAAMGEPGGGRQEITPRLISNFHMLNFTFPTESIMKKIYETICEYKFSGFYEEIKQLVEPLANATIHIFNTVRNTFLPTPLLCHY